MSNGRLRLELSDAGSRFRVGDMKGRIRASTGKSTLKMVTVSLIWSVRMVHSVAASKHAAVCNQPWQGASHAAWRTLRRDRAYKCLKDGLRRCTGLGASQGAVQGAGRLWAAEGRWEGCSTIQ